MLTVAQLQLDDTKRDDKIKRCLRTDEGKELIDKIQDLCKRTTNQLKTARDVIDIHRYQGRLEAWEQILKMKED